MTDPGWADRTYIEPLDLEGIATVLRRERPDALLPTLGGQTALNAAMELQGAGVLDELGIELIGASIHAIETAEDRELFARAMAGVRPALRALARSSTRSPRPSAAVASGHAAAAARDPPGVHARRPGRRLRRHARRAPLPRGARRRRVADRPGAARGVAARLGRVRARGDPRPPRQRDHRLLDREPRSDGRPHRRLGLRGARR